MSKVKKITVTNLKALSSLTADFNGCTAIITGGNNKGKSSFLKSLPERLRGNKPEIILKHGEKNGSAEWELTTGEKFIWTFIDKDGKISEKLTYISERNIKSSISKDISTYYFPPIFDVDEFLNSGPAKQKTVLQKLTGIDFTEIDKLYKDAYDERAFANKRVVEETAKLLTYDPKAPITEIPFDELQTELNGISAHNLRYDNVVSGIEQKNNLVTDNQKEISELEAKIKQIQEKNAVLQSDIKKGNKWIAEEKNKKKLNADELQAQIDAIKEQNIVIADNKKAMDQQLIYDKAVENAALADAEVKRIEKEKLEVIQNASMPEGFGFSNDGITYNDFEFTKDQLSSSAIYIAALKLAAINLGEVKTLHFDASFLDKNSLSEIETWANENDLQSLIERPDFEGGEIEYQLLNEVK